MDDDKDMWGWRMVEEDRLVNIIAAGKGQPCDRLCRSWGTIVFNINPKR